MSRKIFKVRSLDFGRASDVLRLARMPFMKEDRKTFKEHLRTDRQRLFDITKILNKPTKEVLNSCFPEEKQDDVIEGLNKLLRFDHVAILVISPIDFVRDWLKQKGFGKAISFPSAIVSKRLGERYLEKGREIPTTIVKAEEPNGRKLEIFIPQTTDTKVVSQIVRKDIKRELERHFAFMPKKITDEEGLTKLASTIIENGFKSEGGGINRKEGVTTLYFTREGKSGKPIRIELICQGQFQQALENHKKMVI